MESREELEMAIRRKKEKADRQRRKNQLAMEEFAKEQEQLRTVKMEPIADMKPFAKSIPVITLEDDSDDEISLKKLTEKQKEQEEMNEKIRREMSEVVALVNKSHRGNPPTQTTPIRNHAAMNVEQMTREQLLAVQEEIQLKMVQRKLAELDQQCQQQPQWLNSAPGPSTSAIPARNIGEASNGNAGKPVGEVLKAAMKRRINVAEDAGGDVQRKTSRADEEYHVQTQCSQCSMVFDSIMQLLNHRLKIHGEESMLKCVECNDQCSTREEVHKHMNMEYGVFSCWKCDKNWSNCALLQYHEKTCVESKIEEKIKYQCSLCPSSLESIVDLLSHRLAAHGGPAMLKCGICGKVLSSRSAMIWHLNIEYKLHPCKKCGHCSESEEQLKNHTSVCELTDVLPARAATPPQAPRPPPASSTAPTTAPTTTRTSEARVSNSPNVAVSTSRSTTPYIDEDFDFGEGPSTSIAELNNHTPSKIRMPLPIKVDPSPSKERIKEFIPPSEDQDESEVAIECSKCKMVLATVGELVDHRQQMHSVEDMLICSRCGEVFETRRDVERHMNIEYGKFKCLFCENVSHDERSMHQHEMRCPKGKTRLPMKCPDCDFIALTTKDLALHRHRIHKSPNVCWLCKRDFLSLNGFGRHLSMTEFEEFKCRKCARLYWHKNLLIEHEKTCSDDKNKKQNEKVLTCQNCAQSTMRADFHSQHESECQGTRPIEIKCTICLGAWKTVAELLVHRNMTHGPEAMLQCGLCKKKFQKKKQVRRHITKELGLYKCLNCSESFERSGLVFEHEKTCGETRNATSRESEEVEDMDVTEFDENLTTVSANGSIPDAPSQDEAGPSSSQLNFSKPPKQCRSCGMYISCVEWLEEHQRSCNEPKREILYRCNLCPAQFGLMDNLLQHRKVHGKSAMYSCVLCEKTFTTRKGIQNHLYQEYKVYPCVKCSRPSQNLHKLERHEKYCATLTVPGQLRSNNGGAMDPVSHEAIEEVPEEKFKFKCDGCGRRTSLKYVMDVHERECTGVKIGKDIECKLCSIKFETVTELINHRISAHGQEMGKLCAVCDKKFDSKHGLHLHLTQEFGLFPCMKCGNAQPSSYHLHGHEKNCRRSDSDASSCLKCGMITYSQEILLEHEPKCVGETPKDIKCILCYQEFLTVTSLLMHLSQNHSELAMLTCGICGKVFETKCGIWFHLNQEYRIIPCLRCGKAQANERRLFEHEKACLATKLDAMLQCDICLKISFLSNTTKEEFDEHVEKCAESLTTEPEGEASSRTDVECTICNETFLGISDIITHRQKFHEEVSKDCPICATTYETKQGLMCHLAVEYGIYQCPRCKKPCVSQKKLNEHEQHCKKSEMKEGKTFLKCSKCDKYKTEDLESHEETCNGSWDGPDFSELNCIYCEMSFLNVISFVYHLFQEHPDNATTCVKCDRKLETKHGAMMHYNMEFSPFRCSKCEKPQRTKALLEEHEEMCSYQTVLECEICHIETFSEDMLELHKPTCNGERRRKDEPEIECKSCSTKFILVNDYLIHRKQNHGGEAAMLKCEFCGKKFNSKSGIVPHMNIELGLFPCAKCSRKCRSEAHLKEHTEKCNGIDVSSASGTALMACSKCPLQTYSPVSLAEHEKICREELYAIRQQIPRCHLCADKDEYFMSINDLMAHRMSVHEKKDWYDCQFCDKKFDSKVAILRHMLLEFGTYECQKCHCYFTTAHRLEEHEKSCEIVLNDVAGKCDACQHMSYRMDLMEEHILKGCDEEEMKNKFECDTCQNLFLTLKDLLHHRKIVHSEIKMLECTMCPKKFASRTGIMWHAAVEYGLYKCQFCGLAETTKTMMRNHERDCSVDGCEEKDEDLDYTRNGNDEQLNCPKCRISTYSKVLLNDHAKICDGSPTLTRGKMEIDCSLCEDEKFLSIPDLLTHRKEMHGEEEMLKCGKCANSFESRSKIRQHLIVEFKLHTCSKCGVVFANKRRRIDHQVGCRGAKNEQMKARMEQLDELVECEKCGKGTFYQQVLEEHLEEGCEGKKEENGDVKERFKCNLCPASLLRIKDYLIHREKEHGEEAMLKCPFCPSSYETKPGIEMHLNLEFEVHKCHKCSKCCVSSKLLTAHLKTCGRQSSYVPVGKRELPEPMSCTKCAKFLYLASDMEKHEAECEMEEMTGKPLECSICGMVWLTVRDLLSHRKDKHGEEMMLKCGKCGDRFANRDFILRHITMEYEIHKCVVCGKTYRCRQELSQHKLKCRQPKKYTKKECTKCGRFDFDAALVEEHEKSCDGRNHGEIPITCNNCDDVFLTTNGLRLHRELKYGVEQSRICPICDTGCKDLKGILYHLNREFQVYKCRKCGRPMGSENRRRIHENTCSKRSFVRKEVESPISSKQIGLEKNEEESYDCPKCSRRAFNLRFMKEHLDSCQDASTDSLPEIDCSLCDAKYVTISDLLTHRERKHGMENMLKCGVCGKMSNSKSLIHLHLNKEYAIYQCDGCQRSFEDLPKLNEHKPRCERAKSAAPSSSGNRLSLDSYNETMGTDLEDSRMEVDFADGVEEVQKCPICQRSTQDGHFFAQHVRNCKNDGVGIDCWDCDEKWLRVDELVRHRVVVHGAEEGHKCGFCKRKVLSESGLINHLTLEFQVHKCQKCNRCFDSEKKLDDHTGQQNCGPTNGKF